MTYKGLSIAKNCLRPEKTPLKVLHYLNYHIYIIRFKQPLSISRHDINKLS